jgi:hypothetical protein
MHLKNPRLATLLAAAAFSFALSGCGDTGFLGDGGSPFCSSDSVCKAGEICHPTAKLCVKTCTSGSDCPSEAKTCDLPNGMGTAKVCQCSTSAICGMTTSGNICQDYDKVCSSKCSSNAGCPSGRSCDTASGQCLAPSGNTDGGTDGGAACTQGSCTGGKVCNFANGACETAKVCVAANTQPDVCSYGQYCATASCAEIPVATCSNFAAGSNPLAWNPATATGPVIWKREEVADDAAFCKTNTVAFTLQLSAYRTDADWPAQLSAVPGFKYVTSASNEIDATTLMRPSGYVVNGKNATFKITLCAMANAPFNAGFYFTGGNAACVSLTQGTQGTTP